MIKESEIDRPISLIQGCHRKVDDIRYGDRRHREEQDSGAAGRQLQGC